MTLRVTFEIIPFGVESDAYTVGTLDIHNVGRSAIGWGKYDVSFVSDGKPVDIKGISHCRQDGFLKLSSLAICGIVEKMESTTE